MQPPPPIRVAGWLTAIGVGLVLAFAVAGQSYEVVALPPADARWSAESHPPERGATECCHFVPASCLERGQCHELPQSAEHRTTPVVQGHLARQVPAPLFLSLSDSDSALSPKGTANANPGAYLSATSSLRLHLQLCVWLN
jgi:hypothetical protein